MKKSEKKNLKTWQNCFYTWLRGEVNGNRQKHQIYVE